MKNGEASNDFAPAVGADAVLERFPKTRPELPPPFEAVYQEHSLCNRRGQSFASALSRAAESWMHRCVAADASTPVSAGATLEIGAGILNHLAYETGTEPYDIVEPCVHLYNRSLALERIRDIYADIRDVPNDLRYKRIISIATFEHLCDLPEVTARCGLLLENDGVLRVAVPSEGTKSWQWAQSLTTGLEFRLKHGLDYKVLRLFEHVNRADEIEHVLSYFFESITLRFFGLSKKLSLYQSFVCRQPRLSVCRRYLMLSDE